MGCILVLYGANLSIKEHKIEKATMNQTICILGGTGFVGLRLTNRLAAMGHKIIVPSRRRERHRDLLVIPNVDVIECNITDYPTLRNCVKGCDTVINLVAILNERKSGDFERIHFELARNIAHACEEEGVKRILHMSALNAKAQTAPSAYLRSKGEGEDVMHQASNKGIAVTSFRPSVIFGPGDSFFNKFACLLRFSPLFFPLACAQAKFAPIYVEDVVTAMVNTLTNKETYGQRYDLCGPKTYTLEQLVEYTNKTTGMNRSIIGLGDTPSRLLASIMGLVPGKPLTKDNYLSTKEDAVCDFPSPILGEDVTSLEAVVPFYVGRKNQRALYDSHRYHARRDPVS